MRLALFLSALTVIGAVTAKADPLAIVALGDSLTAGYQLDPGKGFVPQLQAALREKGHDVTVVDAGVSGDTTSGGLARLDWSVGPEAGAVIVELGANDALRGLDPETTRKNLTAILDRLDERGLPVLLAGMLAPPNLGEEYGAEFEAVYDDLSKRDVIYYPFFLDGVAANPSLNLADGMHPTAEGVAVIVQNILPKVEALITKASQRP
ncbi:arylesterase [Acuticoccus sediminis]|uniref:Arylesterase n=1 Tax=Acuticoccus sediminis TaxID=2184697 RepID=A0A8B2NTA8_9HYPH|nr:arylesterase [Acuticoccus sediminis]RAI03438.1 arylesterase [Acuticoccus sediminis]